MDENNVVDYQEKIADENARIDKAIQAKVEKLANLEKNIAKMLERKRIIQSEMKSLEEKKSANFSKGLLHGLQELGVSLNSSTLKDILNKVQNEKEM
jgi:hypothetical protein